MCVYCTMGDHHFKFDPPWDVPDTHPVRPFIPKPVKLDPIVPWDLQRLREYHDLLKRVKELEDQLGCPCEPNKADYIKLFEERIAELERRTKPGEQR